MSQPFFLNKDEKEKRVIELHLVGKTIREIAKELHMSFTPISKIIKAYERKKELQAKREENNQNVQIKKLSQSSRAFILFRKGKKIPEVKVLLDIPFKKAMIFWAQYLKSTRMGDCYDFYQVFQNDLPILLPINNFMKRNNVSGNDIVNVLRQANDVTNLNQLCSNIKNEIEKLKQIKNNLQDFHNNYYPPLKPLPKPTIWNYQYTNNLL
jgi:hypothetical protein